MGHRIATIGLLAALLFSACGCTGVRSYFQNGFKVGPGYQPPNAPVECRWIDEGDKRVSTVTDDLNGWWTVFGDEQLNALVLAAYRQNISLREAGMRILIARAQLGITRGNIFPQTQNLNGGYTRFGVGENFFDQFNFGFNLAWELDFWGRYRRAILAGEATLDATVNDYDDVLVTLLGDVASAYVTIRTTEERIRLAENIAKIQEDVLRFIVTRLDAGFQGVTTLDRAQAESNLKQTLAGISALKITLRTSQNQLCVLLGTPPQDLTQMLAAGPKRAIPLAPDFVAVGVPAQLLGRRPDLRSIERQVAAQAQAIGIATADWYPRITLAGSLSYQARSLSDLFTPQALNSNVGPSFQWPILNYGRILNNVKVQRAEFERLIAVYQNSAVIAASEVENGIVTFIQSGERARALGESVEASYLALNVIVGQYEAGLAGVDFNRYATILQTLVSQQDLWAQARGQTAQGLIDTYRALGGGWQIRINGMPDKRGVLSTPGAEPANPIVPAELPDPNADPDQPPAPAPPVEASFLPGAAPPVTLVSDAELIDPAEGIDAEVAPAFEEMPSE